MTRHVSPATLDDMLYHPEDDEPTGNRILGIGLAIAGALVAGVVILGSALALAAYVVINSV